MYTRKRGFMKDMNREDLFKMRDSGMSNKAIAVALGCSYQTVLELIGKQPKDITSASCRVAQLAAHLPPEGGCTVERKMQSFKPQREEPEPEQAEAVLAVKRAPVMLSGAFMDYVVSADSKSVEVEKEGRVLMQIPAENLITFIKELAAISRNIGEQKPMQFWG